MFKYIKLLLWIFALFWSGHAQEEMEYEGYDQDQNNYDEEDFEFQQYSELMTNFIPTQTFEFQLKVTEQETLILWPTNQVAGIRGVYYLSGDQKGLFMGVQTHGQIKKSFYNKKLGVWNVPFEGAGDMKMIFKAEIEPVRIYVTYELVKKKEQQKQEKSEKQEKEEKQKKIDSQEKMQKKQEQINDNAQKNPEKILNQSEKKEEIEGQHVQYQEGGEGEHFEDNFDYQGYDDKNELQEIVKMFNQVHDSLNFQQLMIKQISKHEYMEATRLQDQINNKTVKLVIETIFVIASGLFSLWMLKKEFRQGYEGLV